MMKFIIYMITLIGLMFLYGKYIGSGNITTVPFFIMMILSFAPFFIAPRISNKLAKWKEKREYQKYLNSLPGPRFVEGLDEKLIEELELGAEEVFFGEARPRFTEEEIEENKKKLKQIQKEMRSLELERLLNTYKFVTLNDGKSYEPFCLVSYNGFKYYAEYDYEIGQHVIYEVPQGDDLSDFVEIRFGGYSCGQPFRYDQETNTIYAY